MEVMSQIVSIHEERNPLPTGAGDAPMIKGVKVLGVESKNGRKYPVEVMRKALEKYDGAMVNIDHPKGDEPRSYEDRFGRLVNPRLEADGIYADLSYNPKHPLAEGFAWWAANDPSAVGLSHNAQARTKLNREGVEEIEEIVEVTSVDLVAEPATTAGLMECVMKAKSIVEAKQPRQMSLSELRNAENKLKSKDSQLNDKIIAKGWGNLSYSELLSKHGSDPDVSAQKKLQDELSEIRYQIDRRGKGYKPEKESMKEEDKVIPKPKPRVEAGKVPSSEVSELFRKVLIFQNNLKKLKDGPQMFNDLYKSMYPLFDKAGPKTKSKLNDLYTAIADRFPGPGAMQAVEKNTQALLDFLRNVQDISEGDPTKEADGMEEPELFPVQKEDGEEGGYEDSIKDQVGDIVMDDSLGAEEKVAKLLALMGQGGEMEADDAESAPDIEEADMSDDEETEEAEDEKEPEKTEESLRRKPSPALARILEEVDAYRARDRREKSIDEARKACEEAALPKYAITEAFLGILADSKKANWKNLLEDRRRVIFRGEKPISVVPADGKLTVDSLVKALRS